MQKKTLSIAKMMLMIGIGVLILFCCLGFVAEQQKQKDLDPMIETVYPEVISFDSLNIKDGIIQPTYVEYHNLYSRLYTGIKTPGKKFILDENSEKIKHNLNMNYFEISLNYYEFVNENKAIDSMLENMISNYNILAKAKCDLCVVLDKATHKDVVSRYVSLDSELWECDEAYKHYNEKTEYNFNHYNLYVIRKGNRLLLLFFDQKIEMPDEFREEIIRFMSQSNIFEYIEREKYYIEKVE